MAKISSSIGSRTYQSGMKEFTVSDESDMNLENNQEIDYQTHMRYRQEKNQNVQEKITDSAKKRIEMLCGMTQLSREIKIGDALFVIKALKNKDNRQSLTSSMKYDGTIEFPFELRKQILARCIVSISDIELGMFLGDDSLQSKLNFIDELDDFVAEKLYQEYLSLNKEIKDKFSLKTEEDVKEVAEDLKK